MTDTSIDDYRPAAQAPSDPMMWVKRLYAEMNLRRPIIKRAANYYDGDHNLAFASEKFLEAFGGLFRAFADNWCATVVDAAEERLNIDGFRVSTDVEKADKKAWSIWQRNELDAQSQIAHQESLYAGAAYVTAWPGDDGKAVITVESAMGSIIDCHPKFARQRRAGMRTYLDDEGFEHAELFLPDRAFQFRSKTKRTGGGDPSRGQWMIDPDAPAGSLDSSGSMRNPWGVVPMVELRNRPRLHVARRVGWAAHSEIASIMPLQDAVNKLVADMLVASEFAAAPQRFVAGYTPKFDEQGNEIQPTWRPGAGRTWTAESNEDGTIPQFGQFQVADLSNFTKAIGMVIQHIASISRTPQHYLDSSADRLSGESIKAAETGLVAKVRRKMRPLGEAWEEIMRIAGMIDEIDELKNATEMETIWGDPETRTESQHIDALVKKISLGVPLEQLQSEAGYTPPTIARFAGMIAKQALMNFANTNAESINPIVVPPKPLAPKPLNPLNPVAIAAPG